MCAKPKAPSMPYWIRSTCVPACLTLNWHSKEIFIQYLNGTAHQRGSARLIHNSKLRISLVPLRCRFISGTSANGRSQNYCTRLDRHTTNQRDEACDVTRAQLIQKTWLQLVWNHFILANNIVNGIDTPPICEVNTFTR